MLIHVSALYRDTGPTLEQVQCTDYYGRYSSLHTSHTAKRKADGDLTQETSANVESYKKNLAPNRRCTAERGDGRIGLERGDDPLDGGISAQDRTAGCAQHVEKVEGLDVPLSGETALEPGEAGIETCDLSSGRVETLAGLHGMLSDFKAEHEKGREGVGKLQDADGCDQGRQVRKLRDRGGDDEGDDPIYGNDADPQEFASLLGQRWKMEDIREEVVVKDLDTDVAVKSRGDQGGDESDDVGRRLPVVGR